MPRLLNSIIAGPLARKLADAWFAPARSPFDPVRIAERADAPSALYVSAFPCYRTRRDAPSATVRLEACAPIRGLAHCGRPPVPEVVRYVRNATPDRIYSHAADLIERVRQNRDNMRPLLMLRERVYQLAEARVIPDGWDAANADGRPIVYDEMSADDCAHWIARLETLQPKGAA